MMRWLLGMLLLAALPQAGADPMRIKDLGKFAGWRDNPLTGYGLVTGLAGTGDSSRNKATRQSIANMLSRFDMTIVADDVQSRNAAAVMVTATLPPFARAGDALDVTITSLGDARSLVGGTLILAPLKAADGQIYALAQGPLTVGGYKYDVNGNVVQKNHPTVAAIPGGGIVEQSVVSDVTDQGRGLTFVLSQPDFTTASRIAGAINRQLGEELARAEDAGAVAIRMPARARARATDFVTAVENVAVEPDLRARVVINERTGTIVAGGDVQIAKVVVSQGDLKVTVSTEYAAAQPVLIGNTGPLPAATVLANSQLDVREAANGQVVSGAGRTVADLVQALARIKTSTRDIISVLRAVKAAGALHAELVVQ